MIKGRLLGTLIASLAAALCVAEVQAQNPPLPKEPPLLHDAPPFSSWTITFTYPDDRPAKTQQTQIKPSAFMLSRPRRTITTKTDNVIHEESVDLAGNTWEKWYAGSKEYIKKPGQVLWSEHEPTAVEYGADYDYSPLPPSGFRNAEWIGAASYVGSLAAGQTTYSIYAPGGQEALSADAKVMAEKLASLSTVAYLDATTQLPVVIRTDGETRTYAFGASPTAMQTLPPDLGDQIKKGDEGRARLAQPAPRPY